MHGGMSAWWDECTGMSKLCMVGRVHRAWWDECVLMLCIVH